MSFNTYMIFILKIDFRPIGPMKAMWYRGPIWTNFAQDK